MRATMSMILVTAMAATLLCSACETSTPDDPERSIVGRLGTGFSPKTLGAGSRSIAGVVSAIASFGVVAGQLSAQTPVGVLADGSFSVPLDSVSGGDQVLLFADGAAPGVRERFDSTGFIVLPTADGGGMSRIPVSEALVDTVDLGTISLDVASNLGFSSLDRDAQAAVFGMGFDRLQAYYRFDNVLRMARNIYVNNDPASDQWVDAGSGQSNSYLLSSIKNSYSSPTAVSHRVFSVNFNIKYPVDHGYADIAAGTVIVEVVPPSDITIDQTTHVYGPSKPLATNDVLDLGGGWNVGADNTLGSGSYGMGISIADASGIPGGTWVLRRNGADFALFDFASLAPYDDAGHFLYFIPSIQASVETDGRLTRLDLRWYAYDKVTSDYALITDTQQLDEWLHYYGFGIGHTDNTVSPPTSIEEISSNMTSITDFRNQWYFDSPPSSGVQVSGVWVLYTIGSMSFSFNYTR